MIKHRHATALTLNAKQHKLQLRDHNQKNLTDNDAGMNG